MSDLALTIFANLLSAIAIASVIFMIRLSTVEIANKRTRRGFIAILLMHIVQQSCFITTYQIRYTPPLESLSFLVLLSGCFGEILVLENILKIFSVLDERITPPRLAKGRIAVWIIFAILALPSTVYMITVTGGKSVDITAPLGFGNELVGILIILLTVIIEQATSVKITIMIFRNAKSNSLYKQLVQSISLFVLQALLDYGGFYLEACQIILYDGSSYADLPNAFANRYQILSCLATLHSTLSVFTFIQFKRLFIAGKKVEEESKATKSAAPVKLLDVIKAEKQLEIARGQIDTAEYKKTVIIERK